MKVLDYIYYYCRNYWFQSTKDVQLNAFYIRGYSEAENLVSTTEEGLVRAALQDYAFFSGQRVARTTLRFDLILIFNMIRRMQAKINVKLFSTFGPPKPRSPRFNKLEGTPN